MKAARQFFDQMPLDQADKEKIAHLNAERLFVNFNAPKRVLTAAAGA